MVKACFFSAFLCLVLVSPLQAFSWETATSNGREYVTLQSFCTFYGFSYQHPGGGVYFDTRSQSHSLRLKLGSPDMYLDGVHYVMSFAVESGDHDWLVSRMDVIKLFEPIIRPTEISDRHTIRGVVLDAGHGGSDNGAVSARGGMEKSYTIDTIGRLEAILREAGLKTVLTRRSDVFVDLYERAHIASLYPDYAFVSIHFNSATPEARGLETYCLSPRGAASTSSAYLTRSDIQKLPGNDYDESNILLASMVHSEIIKLNPGDPTADRGVKRARFVVIKQNVLPAILVEGGFVSNRMEAARVNRPDYRQSLAEAVARGIIRFVNVMGDRHMSLPGGSPEFAPPVAPSVAPQVPVAPSGLANDPMQKGHPIAPPNGSIKMTSPPVANAVTPANSTTNLATQANPPTGKAAKSKKGKKKALAKNAKPTTSPTAPIPAAAPTTADAATPAGAPASASDTSTAPLIHGDSGLTNQVVAPTPTPANPPSAPLNLAEPATPAPTSVPEKPSAEPDEPPTVNIYPTTSGSSSKPTAPETSPTPSPAPESPATSTSPAPDHPNTNAVSTPTSPGTP